MLDGQMNTMGRSGRHTHGLLLGLPIHRLKSSVTSCLHSGTPLEHAVLMELISLYLPQVTLGQLPGPDCSKDSPAAGREAGLGR